MKKMKFLLGVLGCFLLTLSFGVNKVHAAQNPATNPSEYFTSLEVVLDGETRGLDVLNDAQEGMIAKNSSCITVNPEFCIGDKIHVNGTIADGVTVTYGGRTYTSADTFSLEFTVEETFEVAFKAKKGSGEEYDFSITIEENRKCKFCESDPSKDDEIMACIDNGGTETNCVQEYCPRVYCEADPSKDQQIKECLDAGEKSEADCVQEYCPSPYCELDPSKDPEIKECIEGGKTEEECVKSICTFCKEDPSKDKDVKKCIDEGGKETDCIQKICVKENPKTGITSPIVGIAGLITLVVANVLIFRKREN